MSYQNNSSITDWTPENRYPLPTQIYNRNFTNKTEFGSCSFHFTDRNTMGQRIHLRHYSFFVNSGEAGYSLMLDVRGQIRTLAAILSFFDDKEIQIDIDNFCKYRIV